METTDLAMVVAIAGIATEVIKRVALPSRWAPLVALASAALAAGLLAGWDAEELVAGLIAGASACGLWSGTKALTQGSTADATEKAYGAGFADAATGRPHGTSAP